MAARNKAVGTFQQRLQLVFETRTIF